MATYEHRQLVDRIAKFDTIPSDADATSSMNATSAAVGHGNCRVLIPLKLGKYTHISVTLGGCDMTNSGIGSFSSYQLVVLTIAGVLFAVWR